MSTLYERCYFVDLMNALRYPHPLVSILQPLKGKKVMKRLTRVMDSRQLRITMTLVTRLFPDFDVVRKYALAESLEDTKEKHEMERHVLVFEEFVLEAVLPALAVAPLPFVSGQLQLLRDPVKIAQTGVRSVRLFPIKAHEYLAWNYSPYAYFQSCGCYQ